MKYGLKKLAAITLISTIIALGGCGGETRSGGVTYDQQMEGAMNLYRTMRFIPAMNAMSRETSRIMRDLKIDQYLAFLEFGKMSLAARYYPWAIKYMTQAEARHLNIEGTISIREEVSSIFTNDTSKEYALEPHETVMISPYLALAYASKGDAQGAFVERNRAISRISEYIERTNKRWLENPFARYLTAVLYEKQNKQQDARLEYNKIVQRSNFKFLAKEALENLSNRNKGNFVLFIDIGLSPVKRQEIYDRDHPHGEGSVKVRFAYAVMAPSRYNRIKKVRVLIDGQESGNSVLLYNLEKVVLTQFAKNKEKIREGILKRVLPRVIAQVAGQTMANRSNSGGVRLIGALMSLGARVGMAIERADTRSWLTLPRLVHAFRARGLSEGEHTYQVQYLGRNNNVLGTGPVQKFRIKTTDDIAVAHVAAPY